jgi:glycosyltransferase involved in cell wall biosynthesis
MPHVTVVTPMRNAERYLIDYSRRIDELEHPKDQLRVVVVEGDSVDATVSMVTAWAEQMRGQPMQVSVVKCDTGKPHYGSVVNGERFWTLATVFNAGLEAVDMDWTDYVLVVPVDIMFRYDLLSRLLAWKRDVIAPFVYMNGVFYDIWAFSMEDQFFGPFPEITGPIPEALTEEVMPLEMTTIGGTMLIAIDVLDAGVRYGLVEVDRDFSRDARAAGFRLWADPTTSVYHIPR